MAWEQRGNGTYYYWKRRIGGRVVSEYVGNNPMIQEILDTTESTRERETRKRKIDTHERERLEKVERELDKQQAAIRALMKGVYTSYGYHQHKGQWRRKRE